MNVGLSGGVGSIGTHLVDSISGGVYYSRRDDIEEITRGEVVLV